MISWVGKDEFEIDDIRFTIDISPGGRNRRMSTENNFTLVKPKSYINDYLALEDSKVSYIVELGMFQGGSIVFFDKIFKPRRIVGIDISPNKIGPLENYIARTGRPIKTYYHSSQDDASLLASIFAKDLDGKLDLVVDDASHMYEITKKSISILFPMLSPGGMYIIEDWAWSHGPNAQVDTHPWHNKPALTNLIFDLIVALGGNQGIAKIEINHNMAKITKARPGNSDGFLGDLSLRGREMVQI
ncbi:MAG: CmcI family methyltransferase [Gammaproteobacteria bacterium]